MKFKRVICGFLVSIIAFFTVCMSLTVKAATSMIELTTDTFGLTDGYSKKTATVDGFEFVVDTAMKGTGSTIQMNEGKGTASLYNQNAIESIVSIELDYNTGSSKSKMTVYAGTSLDNMNSVATYTGTHSNGNPVTIDMPDNSSYTFMKITIESNAHYFKSIKITYGTVDKYNVNFYDGETVLDTVQVVSGEKASSIVAPEKDGFVFDNWYKEPTFENVFNFDTEVITAETNIYAKYLPLEEVKTYNVTFVTNCDTSIEPVVVVEGNLVAEPTTELVKDGYRFDGWYSDEKCTLKFDFTTPINGNTTLYANWIQECLVQFDTDNGSAVNPQVVLTGELATKPSNDPTKDGFRFAGWYTSKEYTTEFDFNTPITTDTVVYAKWVDPNVIELDGMQFHRLDQNTTVDLETGYYIVSSASASVENFMSSKVTSSYMNSESTPSTYFVITKVSNGYTIQTSDGKYVKMTSGDMSLVNEYSSNCIYELGTDDEGYKFIVGEYWLQYNAGSPRFKGYKAISNQITPTLYKADVEFFSIKFMNEDVLFNEVTAKEGTFVTEPTTNPTKVNYNFTGWYTDPVAGELFNFEETAITKDTVLYAHFAPKTAAEIFETYSTKAGLRFDYSETEGVYTVSNVGLKFGTKMSKLAFDENANYGVLVINKNQIANQSFNTLVNSVKEGKDVAGIVEALAEYNVKNYGLTPVRVNEAGVADENGEYYQFAAVLDIDDLDLPTSKDVTLSAIVYMELDGQVYLMSSRTTSVTSLASEYLADTTKLGITDEVYLNEIVSSLEVIKGGN